MTREEAIRILASSCIPGSKQTEALETLIPELRESEDERIRKELIKYHKQQFENNRDQEVGLFHKDALAYLEKQKENPKSADSISSDCMSDVKCGDRDSNYGVFPEDVIVVARACEKLKTHGYPELAYALKNVNLYTKEQKPAEWSDTDNIGWDEAFACVTRAEKSAKNEEELQNAVTAEKWLKEIKFKYYVHPIKQEWSEEVLRRFKEAKK